MPGATCPVDGVHFVHTLSLSAPRGSANECVRERFESGAVLKWHVHAMSRPGALQKLGGASLSATRQSIP
jgi:hypothetical protein